MAANITEIRQGVTARVKDAGILSTTPDLSCDVDRCILSALEEYAKARPRRRAALIDGSGGFDYATSLLSGWQDDFSYVAEIIYPWDSTTPTPFVLNEDEYEVKLLSTGSVLRFKTAKPGTTEKFHVTYTSPHTLSSSTSTVPATDDEALKDLSAALCCEALAAYYSQTSENSISADAVQRIQKADSYRASAKRWREAFKAKMSSDEDGADRPAMAVTQIDTRFSNDLDRLFFHGRRR